MKPLARLLGSENRANVVEALALSDGALTAYRVATMYGMNVAKAYSEMKRLAELGVIEKAGGRRGAEYRLADPDLRRLALRFSKRTLSYENWKSPRSKRERFRMGLGPIPAFTTGTAPEAAEEKPSRIPGELLVLATIGRRRFDRRYRAKGARAFDLL
jgi:hypothetical protein